MRGIVRAGDPLQQAWRPALWRKSWNLELERVDLAVFLTFEMFCVQSCQFVVMETFFIIALSEKERGEGEKRNKISTLIYFLS